MEGMGAGSGRNDRKDIMPIKVSLLTLQSWVGENVLRGLGVSDEL